MDLQLVKPIDINGQLLNDSGLVNRTD